MRKFNLLKKAVLTVFTFGCCLFSSQVSKATHIAGGEITYQHLTGNNYKIILTLFRDCAGNNMQPNYNISVQSTSCAQNLTVQVTQETGTGAEITLPCASGGTRCSSASSTVLGIQKYVYSGTISLVACTDWIISWDNCCRNCAITTTVHSANCANDPQSNIYLESRLNNKDGVNNNSPVFSVNPVTTLCVGQNINLNNGVTDPDGDVIRYHLIGSAVSPTATVTYKPGYSAINPLNSSPAVSIDSISGDLNITPQISEVGVMAVRIDEYRGGKWIGSVVRDLQIVTQPCTNSLPSATGMNGNNVYDTIICPGTHLCFYIFTSDPDNNQNVSITTNNAIPNSAFNNSGGQNPTASFCWTPTAADARMTPWTFVTKVRDDACPTNGLQTYAFSILIPYMSPSAVVNDTTGSINMTVTGNTGSYTYLWSTGATTEDVSGLSPGVYTLTVCEAHGCCITTQDTIHTVAACHITVGQTHHNPACGTLCDGWIHLIPHGTAPYQYTWATGQTTQNLSNICGGKYAYTVTDAAGCTHKCTVSLTQPTALSVTCTADSTCIGGHNGSALVTVTGGKLPFRYHWGNGALTPSITGLSKATYCVTVTDTNGCVGNCCTNVGAYQGFAIPVKIVDATSIGSCDGKFAIYPSGGTPPYSFVWSTGVVTTGALTDSIIGLCPGTYTVTITDANGCTRKCINDVGPTPLRNPHGFGAFDLVDRMGSDYVTTGTDLKATVIPNPFNNDFVIETSSGEVMNVHIYNMTGALVGNYAKLLPGKRMGADLKSGLYIIVIEQAGETVYQRIAKQDQ